MNTPVQVLFTPADFAALNPESLLGTTCVVFDVLRATSTMVTALANGAQAIYPVADIAAALDLRRRMPDALLGGERHGVRIRAAQTGGVDFDFGNSPREYSPERVSGRTLITTTTNGTRALRACGGADVLLAGSFLNLAATARWILTHPPQRLLLVCAGTGEEAAWEDALAAGALWDALLAASGTTEPGWILRPHEGAAPSLGRGTARQESGTDLVWEAGDSAHFARQLYRESAPDLLASMQHSRNARRLLAMPELAPDVAVCLQRDAHPVVASMGSDGAIRLAAGCAGPSR